MKLDNILKPSDPPYKEQPSILIPPILDISGIESIPIEKEDQVGPEHKDPPY